MSGFARDQDRENAVGYHPPHVRKGVKALDIPQRFGRDPSTSKYHLQFCLEWLHSWKNKSPEFKYNTKCISEILKYIFEEQAVPDKDVDIFCEFMATNRNSTLSKILVDKYWDGIKIGKKQGNIVYVNRAQKMYQLIPQLKDEVKWKEVDLQKQQPQQPFRKETNHSSKQHTEPHAKKASIQIDGIKKFGKF